MIIAGRASPFYLLIIAAILIIWGIRRGQRGDVPTIRRIVALEEIDNAVGRAVELGRPIMMHPGSGFITGMTAAETLAGLDIAGYVAEKAARLGADLRVTIVNADVYPVALERIRSAYTAADKADMYDPEKQVLFFSGEMISCLQSILEMMVRDKVAAAIMTGNFTGDTNILGEGAAHCGALSIGGLTKPTHITFFAVNCDYILIGEELLVAGAYVSKDPVRLGSLRGQDLVKVILLALMVVGGFMASFGSAKSLTDMLKL